MATPNTNVLFSDVNATPNTLGTPNANLAEQNRTFYDRVLLTRLLPNMLWPMFGQSRPMPTKAGSTLQYNGFDSLGAAITPLTEGVTPDGDTLTMSNITAVPKQYGKYVTISDVVDMEAPDPVLTQAAEVLGEQAAGTYDAIVRNILCLGTNVHYTADSSAREEVDTVVAVADLQKVIRTMHSNKIKKITSILNASTGVGTVPVAACYVGIVGAAVLYDLAKLTGWVPVHQYPSTTALLPGEVGAFDEIRFVMTDNPKIVSAAGAGSPAVDVHCSIILGRDAYGIVQVHGVENVLKDYGSGDDPLNQRMTSGWKAFFTAVILQQLAVLRFESTASA